jgi:predicted nucleotidyltransferase
VDANQIATLICNHALIDAVYLYGSRAKNLHRVTSDWDIAVLFSYFESDAIKCLLRPQLLEANIERELKLYNQFSIVDLETIPIYLQYSILMSGIKLFDRNVPHVKRVENSILSKWEKDYERYCIRAIVNTTSTKNVAHLE